MTFRGTNKKMKTLEQRYKPDADIKRRSKSYDLSKGVRLEYQTNKKTGIRYWYYIATFTKKRNTFKKKFSCRKHGDDGAKLLASLQRMSWMVEYGAWSTSDGDPLQNLSYVDSFSGNADYDDCKIVDMQSPYLIERERMA